MTPTDYTDPTAHASRSARRVAFRIAFGYIAVGLVWVLASDYLIRLVPEPLATQLEPAKGALFVIVTAGLVWLIIVLWAGRYAAQVDVTADAELKFEQVMRMVPVGIIFADRNGRVEFLNPVAESMLGVISASVAGHDLTDVVTPLESTLFTFQELMRVGCVNGLEMRGTSDDAATVLVACGTQLESVGGSHEWVIALTDVTDSHWENQRIERLVSGLKFISKALRAIGAASDKQHIFSSVCSTAVEDGAFMAAWIVERDVATSRVQVLASAGFTSEMLREAEKSLAASTAGDPRRGVPALQLGEIHVANNLAHDTADPIREVAAMAGFGSGALSRISESAGRVTELSLFSAQQGFFDQEQIRLITSLREAMTFACEKLVLDVKRLEAEESLARSEAAYRQIFENHPEPMWVYDRATLRFLAVNEAAVRKYGYSHEEFDVMTIIDIRPPEELGQILDAVAHHTSGVPTQRYWTHVDKAGRAFTANVHSNSVTWNGVDAQLVLVQEVPVLQ